MAKYSSKYAVNDEAVAFARGLIDRRRSVLRSDWGRVQPDAAAKNAFLRNHSWAEYGHWHLGLTEGACVYRASEWWHKDVELAAHDLLQYLDRAATAG